MTISRGKVLPPSKTFNCGCNICLTPAIHVAGRIDTSDASIRGRGAAPTAAQIPAAEGGQSDATDVAAPGVKCWAERGPTPPAATPRT